MRNAIVVVALIFPSLALTAASNVSVAIHPKQVRIEASAHAQVLNFDFELKNDGDAPAQLNELRVEVFDRDGKLTSRRKIGENGISPSIHTIPKRVVEPKGRVWLFNPFHTFDPRIPIARLEYAF